MTRAPTCRVACLVLIASFSFAHAQRDPARLPARPELVAVDIGQPIVLRTGQAGRSEYTLPPPLDAGAPLQMVAPRGGHASALAVLRGQKLQNIQAKVTKLAGAETTALPATAIEARWLTGEYLADVFSPGPVEAQVQPILVTVHPPADARPGKYAGKLDVSCAGFAGSLPIDVEVAAWTMPPPDKRKTIVGFLHSPDSIALHYKVEPWSDKHLSLMEPSLRLLADLGGRDCTLFLIAEGLVYERYSMVRYRDGKPDFQCVDRYLDLWQKICGRPRTITLYVWDNRAQNRGGRRHDSYTPENSVDVTRIGANGALCNFDAPYYSTPAAPAFWKPVFDGIRSRVAQRGWKQTELLLGAPWDSWPQEEAVEKLKEITAGLRWRVFTHGFSYPLPDAQGRLNMPCGAEVGWLEVTGPIGVRDMAAKYPSLNKGALMKRTYPMTTVCRNQATMTSPMWIWRDAAPSSIRAGLQGFSQIGMDFWPVDLPGRGRNDLIRNGNSGFEPRHNASKAITVPGQRGAEPRFQYEMVREGLQACEAWWAVRDGKNQPDDAAFDAFVKARLDGLYPVARAKGETPVQVSEIASQAKWNAAVSALFQSAGKVNP